MEYISKTDEYNLPLDKSAYGKYIRDYIDYTGHNPGDAGTIEFLKFEKKALIDAIDNGNVKEANHTLTIILDTIKKYNG